MNQQYAYLNMAYNAYNYSDVRIADGGFIRLKEIFFLMIFRLK